VITIEKVRGLATLEKVDHAISPAHYILMGCIYRKGEGRGREDEPKEE